MNIRRKLDMNQVFDTTLKALAASNKMRELRNNVIGANIANVETPGYKAKKLDFEDALKTAIDQEGVGGLHTSHKSHFLINKDAVARLQADIYDNPEINVSNDGNTVDMEKEMSNLFNNNLMYRAANQLINKKLAALRYAATDGGR